MKKELYISLLAAALLTGCGSTTDSESESSESSESESSESSESGDSSITHYEGQTCLTCHGGSASGAEGKYFRSGVTVYNSLNSSVFVDGYIVKLLMDNGATISYAAGRGVGNANSGLYNTTLDGYSANKYTAQLVNSSGTVVNTSGAYSHDSARLDCNSCHTATGLNGAPGRVTPSTTTPTTTTTTTTTTPSTSTSPLSFSADVMPLLTASCQSCHGSSGSFTVTTALATYSNITALKNGGVDTVTPDNSYLLQKASNSVGHGGGAVWATTNSSYVTVKTWITEGALNN